jgi:hypothetical protein
VRETDALARCYYGRIDAVDASYFGDAREQ